MGPQRRQTMPELPEVEVVRRDLEREIVGKRVKSVDADGMRSIRRHHNRKQFANKLVGKRITGVERRGKYILATLDGGDVLVIHLGMAGQLIRVKAPRCARTRRPQTPPVAVPATTDRVRRRVYVSGRVQGVWFRESCRDEAARAGAGGWVRNLDDGRVEVVLEGPVAAVDEVVAWCHRGPRRARVDRVEVVDEPPVGEQGFRVR